jgi:hypothetical protein
MTRSTPTDDESPARLTGGAWLPNGRGNALVWTPGATPPAWQDTKHSPCGSLTGLKKHRMANEKPCAMCIAARRDYDQGRRDTKRPAA